MGEPNHGGQLVLQSRSEACFTDGKSSVFERFQHSKCFIEAEDERGRNGIVVSAHRTEFALRV